jgi:hypothetical protein
MGIARNAHLLGARRREFPIQLSNSDETCVRIPAARFARVLLWFRPRSMSRGRREDRVRAAPAISCANCTKECAHEHTGSAENTRPSLRNGLRLITCSSRRTAFLPPSPPGSFASRELDTSAAVPEPHAFAVRLARARLSHVRRPPHPIATFVTIATRPSFG